VPNAGSHEDLSVDAVLAGYESWLKSQPLAARSREAPSFAMVTFTLGGPGRTSRAVATRWPRWIRGLLLTRVSGQIVGRFTVFTQTTPLAPRRGGRRGMPGSRRHSGCARFPPAGVLEEL
jgi:hypothetical protein